MKRIIDIPDELYKKIMGHRALTKYQEHIDYEKLKDMIEDSTPLNECEAEDCIERDYTAKYIEEFANNEYVSEHEAETIYTIAEGIRHIPSVYPKSDNSVLEDIKTEIESINDWAIRYVPTEDKDKRAQIVAKVKKHIISIVDKHISGKDDNG